MKIGLILPGNIWFCPYVNIYTQILDKRDIRYDIISWNRDGSEQQGIQFNRKSKDSRVRLIKFLPYFEYATFIKKVVKQNKYDKLIVFGPQVAIFISKFLSKYYRNRFIFDYRDLSIEQNVYFKLPFKKVLRNSFANVISSPGFKKCLPADFEYYLSHNLDIDKVGEVLDKEDKITFCNEKINVLTIGSIRDYSSNIEVIDSLANKNAFKLQFVGKGIDSDMIENYAKKQRVQNIEFTGFYPKEKEAEYIKQASFMNIFYPRVITHDTALSNRFYNALIYRRPMLVTSGTMQGDFVEQYQLGLSVDNCENMDKKMIDFLTNFDYEAFSKNCDKLLTIFMEDYNIFENKVIEFLGEK